MLKLTSLEYQKMVLMLGSKKALGTYLGLDTKAANELWVTHNLMTPLTWLREQSRETQLEMLAAAGSLKALAKRLACSDTALRPIYIGEPKRKLDWTKEFLLEQMERFKSVRLVAHMNDVSESLVRKCAELHEVELSVLIDYSFGDNSNSKGRRAEVEYAALRGDFITEDKNVTMGSQADWDFDDTELGRVNVKSSRQYKFTAQTRKQSPDFWKFSTNGCEKADHFVLMCYNEAMNLLEGYVVKEAKGLGHTLTLTVTREELKKPDGLRSRQKPE